MWLGQGVITHHVPRLSGGRPWPYTQLALRMTQLGLEVAAEKRGAENGNIAHGRCVIFVTQSGLAGLPGWVTRQPS